MLKNVVSYSAKWFVLIFAAAFLAVNYALDLITTPKPTNSIEFFITAEGCDVNHFEKAIALNTEVEEVTVFFRSESQDYYPTILSTSGLASDLVILSTEHFDLPTTADNFAPITAEILAQYKVTRDDLEFLTVKDCDVSMGILVFDKEKGVDLFKGVISFDEEKTYLIALSVNKPNAKPYSKQEKTTDKGYVALSAVLNSATN